jgi:hypothetical protein
MNIVDIEGNEVPEDEKAGLAKEARGALMSREEILIHTMKSGTAGTVRVVRLAETGDKIAESVLRNEISDITNRNEKLSAVLAYYNIVLLLRFS